MALDGAIQKRWTPSLRDVKIYSAMVLVVGEIQSYARLHAGLVVTR
jgi:hypothetical protein